MRIEYGVSGETARVLSIPIFRLDGLQNVCRRRTQNRCLKQVSEKMKESAFVANTATEAAINHLAI